MINLCTPESFLKNKKFEECQRYQCGSVSIDAGLINTFYEMLKDYCIEDGMYTRDDANDAWARALEVNGLEKESTAQ